MICENPVLVSGMDEVGICTDFGESYDVRAAQSPGFAAHVSREENIRVMNFSVLGNNQVFELRKNEKPVSQGIMILFEELPCALITDIYTMPYERGMVMQHRSFPDCVKKLLLPKRHRFWTVILNSWNGITAALGFTPAVIGRNFPFRQTKLLYYKGRENYDPSCHHRRSICSRPAL